MVRINNKKEKTQIFANYVVTGGTSFINPPWYLTFPPKD